MRAAGALRIFAAKLAKADSVVSSAQLSAPQSASTPIYYPARLYLALRLYCFHGNEELTGSRGCGGSGSVSVRLLGPSQPRGDLERRSVTLRDEAALLVFTDVSLFQSSF